MKAIRATASEAMFEKTSGTIAIHVIPRAGGSWVCEMTASLAGRNTPAKSFHGQTQNHAIALALEDLARAFRTEADAEQNVHWDAVDRSDSGEVINKRFHVILHTEAIGLMVKFRWQKGTQRNSTAFPAKR